MLVDSVCRVLHLRVILVAPESPWVVCWAGVQAACEDQVHPALVIRFAGVLQGGQSPSPLSVAYPERQGKHRVMLVAPYAMHTDVLAFLMRICFFNIYICFGNVLNTWCL